MPAPADRLADVQTALLDAIVHGRNDTVAKLTSPGPISFERALRVHQGTVFGGLANALRRSAPTVNWLVGETFFDAMAQDYARTRAPAEADFGSFLDGFADYVAGYAPAASVPYLTEVAHFDRALERCGEAPRGFSSYEIALEADTHVSLAISLAVVEAKYPVDDIRHAFEANDEGALSALDMASPSWLALWRSDVGVKTLTITCTSSAFLRALLSGGDAETALAAALSASTDAAAQQRALNDLQTEVFAAPFTRVTCTTP